MKNDVFRHFYKVSDGDVRCAVNGDRHGNHISVKTTKDSQVVSFNRLSGLANHKIQIKINKLNNSTVVVRYSPELKPHIWRVVEALESHWEEVIVSKDEIHKKGQTAPHRERAVGPRTVLSEFGTWQVANASLAFDQQYLSIAEIHSSPARRTLLRPLPSLEPEAIQELEELLEAESLEAESTEQ